jgi:hypothetical protein
MCDGAAGYIHPDGLSSHECETCNGLGKIQRPTIYTHPEQNGPRLESIINLLDKMISMIGKKNKESQ